MIGWAKRTTMKAKQDMRYTIIIGTFKVNLKIWTQQLAEYLFKCYLNSRSHYKTQKRRISTNFSFSI